MKLIMLVVSLNVQSVPKSNRLNWWYTYVEKKKNKIDLLLQIFPRKQIVNIEEKKIKQVRGDHSWQLNKFFEVCFDEFKPNTCNTNIMWSLNKLINANADSWVLPLQSSNPKLFRYLFVWIHATSFDLCLYWLAFYSEVIVTNNDETRHPFSFSLARFHLLFTWRIVSRKNRCFG